MNTYTWAKPIEQRLQFTSYTGPFQFYSETGEVSQPGNVSLGFSDGTLHFTDAMETMVVSAHQDSRAVFLIEFGAKMVGAFMLSKDRGLLIKHLNERSGLIPIAYKNRAVALIVLPSDKPFTGYIRVKSVQNDQSDQSGAVRINDIANPRIHVPEALMVMYQHLRNVERTGKRPLNKYTFAEHELPSFTNRYPHKNIGKTCRLFNANEAMKWLEKAKNYTPVEEALQREFVLGQKNVCVISFPKQQEEYVKIWCKQLGFNERALFDEGESFDTPDSDVESCETNSQNSCDESFGSKQAMKARAASLAWQKTAAKYDITNKNWKQSVARVTVQNMDTLGAASLALQRTVEFSSGNFANWSKLIVAITLIVSFVPGASPIKAERHTGSFETTKQSEDSAQKYAKYDNANEDWNQKLERIAQDSYAQIMEIREFMAKSLQTMPTSVEPKQNAP